MCGLTGWAGAVDLDEAALRRMCDAVRHRGPDEERVHVEPGRVGLGFRRLSIIDLETGSQPLWNEDRTVAVTCNGEIYNFRELRRRLERDGHSFRSGSDVETIVHLYEELGDELVHRLQGMFAIALWDARRERLLLVRDRLGVKPLYWAEVPCGIVYGSEPGAILASGCVEARPDPPALVRYLTLQYVPAPLSGFAGIRKLAPGERLVFENGAATVERYWTLPVDEARPDAEAALEELDALLADATRGRLISDVPLGAFLSGGIDSSLVVSHMAEQQQRVRTFAIDFPEASYSETEHARTVAAIYGTDHRELTLEPEMVPTIAEAVRFVGEPFADSSMIPTFLLSEVTRRHVTVALSGDGGDEAFGGYPRYERVAKADRLSALAPLARAGLRIAPGLVARLPFAGGVELLARPERERYASTVTHFEPSQLARLCTRDFLAGAGGPTAGWDELTPDRGGRGVDRYLRLDVATYLPGDVLTKVDRMSMAHSLEVRSPLLDYRVQELAARLPADLKLRDGTSKWPLRELARRRGLPAAIWSRPKKGFSVPIGSWFRAELRPWLTELLRDPQTRGRGYFDPGAVDGLLADHLERRSDHTSRLWNLAMLELWHRAWIDPARGGAGPRRRETASVA